MLTLLFYMVLGLETANRKVANLEIQVQKLDEEKRDLNQGMLLSVSHNN